MKTIMIVEDEHIVRLALKTLIDWESNGLRIVYEATNGKDAIEYLDAHSVDIILTDINMPIMDGIAMMKVLNRKGYKGKLIVLSAYNDYNYVREAFMLGASDYILKSDMDPVNVLALVKRIASTAEERFSSNEVKSNDVPKTELDHSLMLKTIAEGNVTIDKNTIEQIFFDMGIIGMYDCIVLKVDAFSSVIDKYDDDKLAEFANHVLETVRGQLKKDVKSKAVYMSPDVYMIIIESGHGSEMAKYNRIESMLNRMRQSLSRYLDISISVGIVRNRQSAIKLQTAYEQAKQLAELRYLFGKGRNIYEETAKFVKQISGRSIVGQEDTLMDAIDACDVARAEMELGKILDRIAMYKSDTLEDLLGYYMELTMIIIVHMNEISNEDLYAHNTNFYEMLKNFETKEEIHQFIRNLLGNMMSYIAKTSVESENNKIVDAKTFIQKNLAGDISLAAVAEHVELSESYFSKLFVKEMGESFIHYVTDLRMKKAQNLLMDGKFKVYEVADAVGYESVEHFSRVFKKEIGMSPKSFSKKRQDIS